MKFPQDTADDYKLIADARRIWNNTGPMAVGTTFDATIDVLRGKRFLVLFVDVPGVGRKGSGLVRSVKSIHTDEATEDNLKVIIGQLHDEMVGAVNAAARMGVRF